MINGIIHDVLSRKKNKPVVLQTYDYRQMFDAIGLEEAISDAFDVGMKDDTLTLVYKANKEIQMAVNTPDKLTDRQQLTNVVLQGDTWGSLLASIQVDKMQGYHELWIWIQIQRYPSCIHAGPRG